MAKLTNEAKALIDPKIIAFDPKNPRNMGSEEIKQEAEFKQLRKSVKDYDVLVPLIVRNNKGKPQPYKLVDGERRLRAALLEKKKLVPVYMVQDDETDGRILAYQIHMLRQQWDKPSEISSIREIRDELYKKHKDINETGIFKKMQEITNHKEHELKDLFILLKYDDATINKVQEGSLAMSYLIQIDASFLAPLKRKFPKLYEHYGDANLRKILIHKAENGKLNNTRYLMDNVLGVFRNIKSTTKLRNIIKKFLDTPAKNVDTIVEKMKPPTETKSKKEHTKATKKGASSNRKSHKGTSVPSQLDHKAKLIEIEKQIISQNVFDLLFNYLREAIIEFEKRASIKFNNELDLQNFIYSILRSLFFSTEFEDPIGKKCGKSNRLDFVLKSHRIIIETKYVRDKEHAKKVSEELSADYPRYATSRYGGTIINYIYDPNKHIANHALFIKELQELLPDAHHYLQ